MVKIDDVTEFLIVVEGFSSFPAFSLMLDALKASASRWKSEQKLSFNDFCSLIGWLMKSKNKSLIKANEEELAALPLWQWMKKLEEWQVSSNIVSASSI
jgi:hypothetical protein